MKGHGSDHPHRRSVRLKGYDYTVAGAYFVTIVTHGRQCLFGEVVDNVMRRNAVGEIVAACWSAIPRHYEHVVLDEWVVMPNHLHGVLVFRATVAMTDGTSMTGGASMTDGTSMTGCRGEASAAIPNRNPNAPSPADASPSCNTTYPHGPTPDVLRPIGTHPGSVGAVIQNFKSVAGRRIRVVWKGEASAADGCRDWRLGIAADASPLRGGRAGGAGGAGRPNPSPVWQRNYHEHIVRDVDDLDRIRRYIRDNPLRWTLGGAQRR